MALERVPPGRYLRCMADAAPSKTKSCPVCGKPAGTRFKPFCSARCADVDLNRWLSGSYAIPTAEAPAEDEPHAPPSDKDRQ